MHDLWYLLKLYLQLIYIALYPIFIISVALFVNVSYLFYPIIIGLCVPPTVVWYIIVHRRMVNYINLLLDSKPKEWNISRLVQEYLKLGKDS